MIPKPEIVDAALAQIEQASKHPTRILAAKAVAQYRGSPAATKINQHSDGGGRRLDVDEVERSARPCHAPNMSKVDRPTLLQRLLRRR